MSDWFKKLCEWGQGGNDSHENSRSVTVLPIVEQVEMALPVELENANAHIAHEILAWQGEWLMEIPRQWMMLYHELAEFAESKVTNMGLFSQIFKVWFFEMRIKPEIRRRSNQLENRLRDEIQNSLNRRLDHMKQQIVFDSDVWHDQSRAFTYKKPGLFKIIFCSALPVIAGMAAIYWIWNGAEVRMWGPLGWFGATKVEWPVVLGGATIIGIAAFALGYKTKELFEKSKNKFMNSIRKHLWKSLIANQLEDALAQQMQKTVFRLSCAFVSRKS